MLDTSIIMIRQEVSTNIKTRYAGLFCALLGVLMF